jgi:hypothetical protein
MSLLRLSMGLPGGLEDTRRVTIVREPEGRFRVEEYDDHVVVTAYRHVFINTVSDVMEEWPEIASRLAPHADKYLGKNLAVGDQLQISLN